MLNLIRNNTQSFGVKLVVAIAALAMMGFGVSTFRSQSSNTIVTIGDYEVKIDKYQRAFENAEQEVRQKYQGRAAEYIKMVNLQAQVVQQLVNNALFVKSAAATGLAVSDKELAQTIYTNPAFLTDERFDDSKYEALLDNIRVDKLSYERGLRESLLTQKYLQFLGSGILFSKNTVNTEYQRYNTEVDIRVIEIKPDLFGNQAKLTEEEIQSYYEQRKQDFQQKAQFTLNFITFGLDDVKDKVIIKDKEIEKYYEKHKNEEFSTKESFLSRHILIALPKDKNEADIDKAREKADQLYKQLTKNRNQFAALAKKYSDDPGSAKRNGDLGWAEKGSLVGEFESTIDGLKKNELSKPFLSAFGFHIVELLDRKPETTRAFDEVKAEISEKIRLKKAARRLQNKVANLMTASTGKSLSEIATAENKIAAETIAFDDAKDLKVIGYSYNIYKDLNSKKVGDKGQLSLAGDQEIVVYEVKNITEPFVKPLKDVKEQIEYYATTEKKQKIAQAKLMEYEAEIKELEQFDSLASRLKIPTR
ncbi:SurA N-terminal domain-containing protein, partial [bacterium]|nr:SurA N-terminal domain-containing protein [bacterium]